MTWRIGSGAVGLALVAWGAFMVYPPAAFIAVGLVLLLAAIPERQRDE